MQQMGVPDLFGEVPVSQSDVLLWIRTVPRFAYTRRARQVDYYVKHWNVAAKIAREKAAGTFWEAVNGGCCPHCGQAMTPALPEPRPASPAALQEEKTRLERRVMVLELLLRAGATCAA